jgi:hypothetical protein
MKIIIILSIVRSQVKVNSKNPPAKKPNSHKISSQFYKGSELFFWMILAVELLLEGAQL